MCQHRHSPFSLEEEPLYLAYKIFDNKLFHLIFTCIRCYYTSFTGLLKYMGVLAMCKQSWVRVWIRASTWLAKTNPLCRIAFVQRNIIINNIMQILVTKHRAYTSTLYGVYILWSHSSHPFEIALKENTHAISDQTKSLFLVVRLWVMLLAIFVKLTPSVINKQTIFENSIAHHQLTANSLFLEIFTNNGRRQVAPRELTTESQTKVTYIWD